MPDPISAMRGGASGGPVGHVKKMLEEAIGLALAAVLIGDAFITRPATLPTSWATAAIEVVAGDWLRRLAHLLQWEVYFGALVVLCIAAFVFLSHQHQDVARRLAVGAIASAVFITAIAWFAPTLIQAAGTAAA